MENATNTWLMEKQFGLALEEEWEKDMVFFKLATSVKRDLALEADFHKAQQM